MNIYLKAGSLKESLSICPLIITVQHIYVDDKYWASSKGKFPGLECLQCNLGLPAVLLFALGTVDVMELSGRHRSLHR